MQPLLPSFVDAETVCEIGFARVVWETDRETSSSIVAPFLSFTKADRSPQNCNQAEYPDQHEQGGNRHCDRSHGIIGEIRLR